MLSLYREIKNTTSVSKLKYLHLSHIINLNSPVYSIVNGISIQESRLIESYTFRYVCDPYDLTNNLRYKAIQIGDGFIKNGLFLHISFENKTSK